MIRAADSSAPCIALYSSVPSVLCVAQRLLAYQAGCSCNNFARVADNTLKDYSIMEDANHNLAESLAQLHQAPGDANGWADNKRRSEWGQTG